MPTHKLIYIAFLAALLAVTIPIAFPTVYSTLATRTRIFSSLPNLKPFSSSSPRMSSVTNGALADGASNIITSSTTTTTNNTTTATPPTSRTPVYFVSHGGPTTMYQTAHPVYPRLQALGTEILTRIQPKAIVVFSAHWQAARPNTVEINVSESEPLLYDFYGFPRSYYMEKFRHTGSKEVARRAAELVKEEGGFEVEEVERGLDHGVFVPFKVMFGDGVDVPVVQVSLLEDERDAEGHLRLGRAVEKLREEGVVVVVSGMAVHNLRDFMRSGGAGGKAMDYAVSFDGALKEAVEREPGEERDREMCALLGRGDARRAHPTFEHLLPIHVGVGAAGEDRGKQLWTLPEGSMSWAQYRFGEVEA